MGPLYPGVYVGSWEIRVVGNIRLAGYRHTAIAMVDRIGNHVCVELVGPFDHWHSEISELSQPYYASWGGYRWAQVAPVTSIARMKEGIAVSKLYFAGYRYAIADSNRFVGMALHHARIRLTAQAIVSIGAAPAFNDFPGI